jgi:hypothetical protein
MAVTLVADPDYLPFLRAACNHHHARVRRVAHRVLTAVESEGNADMENPDTVVERPLVARAAEGQSSDPTSPGATFGDRIGPVTQLKTDFPPPKLAKPLATTGLGGNFGFHEGGYIATCNKLSISSCSGVGVLF